MQPHQFDKKTFNQFNDEAWDQTFSLVALTRHIKIDMT